MDQPPTCIKALVCHQSALRRTLQQSDHSVDMIPPQDGIPAGSNNVHIVQKPAYTGPINCLLSDRIDACVLCSKPRECDQPGKLTIAIVVRLQVDSAAQARRDGSGGGARHGPQRGGGLRGGGAERAGSG